jgi:PhnB protein
MQTAAHLQFKGRCREAFRFYAETLGGRIAFELTYGESPAAKHTAPEALDQIIHARLEFGDQCLLGCDAPADRFQAPQGFNVMVALDDRRHAERVFNMLAAGGNVSMPFMETFWAHGFGMCTDRFGTPWMVNCAKPEAAVEAVRRRA